LITFTIPHRPLPKQRPRVANGHAYTPRKTKDYEDLVAWYARMACKEPLSGDVAVCITLYYKGKRYGDLDNCAKSLTDAMNGICYHDDKQIAHMTIQRRQGEERAEVTICALDTHTSTA
jgi:crossover junction endodeoxyribonuclease RusA